MKNVININGEMTTAQIASQLKAEANKIAEEVAELKSAKDELQDIVDACVISGDKIGKKDAGDDVNYITKKIARLVEKQRDAQTELKDLNETNAAAAVAQQTEDNVVIALGNLNGNFVASEGKWHGVYSNGVRWQPVVQVMDDQRMRDMILNETGWKQTPEMVAKEIARNAGRMYRNVERSFNPPNKHTLNQMDELRQFWLSPVYGQGCHTAFDLLINTIVDNDPEYKAQLEKIIAYRYLFPEDIYCPNPDSSAKGGAGRDTLFNILKIIFTEECVGEASTETFQGTHNGELWGKIWVIISDRNAKAVDYDVFKNLTGSSQFRLRRMGIDATMAPRTFTFFAAGNGLTGAFPIAGTGKGGEDRRVEPIISNANIDDQLIKHYGATKDTVGEIVIELQKTVWQNEEEIAKWLGHIINKHDVKNIKKLLPLHGKHYKTMSSRQKDGFKTFMENITRKELSTNTYPVAHIYDLYKYTTTSKLGKDKFIKKMCEYMTRKTQNEWGVGVKRYYDGADVSTEHRKQVIYDVAIDGVTNQHEEGYVKKVFDFEDFIDTTKDQNKFGDDIVGKICAENILDQYY